MQKFIFILIFCCGVVYLNKPIHANSAPKKPKHDLTSSRFQAGDQAFKKRRDFDQAMLALNSYKNLTVKHPEDESSWWRKAMACYYVGIRVYELEPEKQEEIFQEGYNAGKKAIELSQKKKNKCSPCYFWTSINLALYGKTVGILKMLFALNEVIENLDKSIEMDPSYAYGGAYRLRGLIEQKLPGILGGSNEKSLEFFSLAIKTAPNEPLNYLFLARLLEEEFQEREKAIETVKKGLKIPFPPKDRVEAVDAMEDLEEFLVLYPPSNS